MNHSHTHLPIATGTPLTERETQHYLLFVEHPPVFTLGKSGNINNVLLSEERLNEIGIEFFRTNRGGDITFHGPQQIVGYPILDLEKFDTDIGHYLRNLEEVIILTLADYGIDAGRSRVKQVFGSILAQRDVKERSVLSAFGAAVGSPCMGLHLM